MTSYRSLAALAWRESRFARRRLLLFLSAISLGVAALVAVEQFRAGVGAGVGRGARELLGADAVIGSRRLPGERTTALLDSLAAAGVEVARVTSFVSMASNPATGDTRLARVRGLEGRWPFYGRAVTEPRDAWRALAADGEAIADEGLLLSLGLQIGDSLTLGEARFRLAGVLRELPGEADVSSAFAPRLFVPAGGLPATGLLAFGSRLEHEAYVAFRDPDAARALRPYAPALRAESSRLRTASEVQEDLSETLGRLGSFLRLLGFVALLVGALGVASALSAYMTHETDAVATLRCLGATSAQVVVLYLLQAGALGLIGTLAGVVVGLAAGGVLPALLEGLLPVQPVVAGRLEAAAVGVAAGTLTAVGAALLPVLRTRRVPPLAALRIGLEPDPRRGLDRAQALAAALLAAGFLVLAARETGGWPSGLALALGVAGVLVALRGAAWLAARGAARLTPSSAGFGVRHGLAGLRRPGSATGAVVAALGLGVVLLGALLAAQDTLLTPLRRAGGESRANLVLWDVQPDQAGGVSRLLRERDLPLLQRVPIVPMRIAAVNGRPAADLGGRGRDGSGWAFRREYRSTFRDTVVASERLVDGRWWSADEAASRPAPVSLEEGIAEELGVEVGGRVDWDVQGVIVPTRVAALREVDWARFEPNFFAVFPADALAGAPHTFVLLTRVADEAASAGLQRDVVAAFPNVSALDLARIQSVVDEVVGRVSAAIRFLAAFSLAAGIVVLAGALATTRLQRLREGVLLRALGADRRQLRTALVVEHALLGGTAAMAGLLLTALAGWALARWLLESELSLPALPLAALAGATVLLAAAMGVLAGGEAFRRTPLEALRED